MTRNFPFPAGALFAMQKHSEKRPCAAFSGTAIQAERVGVDGPHARNFMRSGFCLRARRAFSA